MANKNNSTAKKVGRFVTNELLGVDDARRAVSKARKGDIKGALKSAAAGAFELGTTATAVGKGGMLAAKVGAKTVSNKTVEKASSKVGDRVARKVAENSPAPKLGKKGGEFKSVRTNPKTEVTVRRDLKQPDRAGDVKMSNPQAKQVSVSKPKSATYQTRENTMKQRISVEKRMTDRRNADIESAQRAGSSASKKPIKEAIGRDRARTAAQAFIAGKGATRLTAPDKKKTQKPSNKK
jgi:hypothetical protein